MSNAEKFLSIFSKLESVLIQKANSLPRRYYYNQKQPSNVNGCLKTFENYKNSRNYDIRNKVKNEYEFRVILENLDKLFLYKNLRNIIAHNFDIPPIADPRNDVVNGIKCIYNDIIQPKTAKDIMSYPVQTAEFNDNIFDVLKIMSKKGYTNVPILKNNNVVAVLSEKTALRWAADMYDEDIRLNDYNSILDIEKYLDDINSSEDDIYDFISKKLDIYSIEDIFNDYMTKGHRVSTLFVTNSGKSSEKLLGVVTAWDLYKMTK